MKNKIWLLFITLLFSLCSFSQNNRYNDFKVLIEKASKAFEGQSYNEALGFFLDAAKNSKGLNEASEYYVRSQIGAARCYENMESYAEAVNIAKDLSSLKLNAVERQEVSKILLDNSILLARDITNKDLKRFPEARLIYEEAMPLLIDSDVKKLKVRLQENYIVEAKLKLDELNFAEAEVCFKKAYPISDDAGQRLQILHEIASINDNLGDINLSIKCYDEVRRLSVIVGDDYHHYLAIKNEQTIYKSLNDMEKYTEFAKKLDSLMLSNNNPRILGDYYDYIGNEYVDIGNYSVAETYFSRYPNLIAQIDDKDEEASLKIMYYVNMRDLKRKQKDYKSAIDYSSKLAECYSKRYNNVNFIRYIVYLVDTQLYAEINDSVNFERCADSLRYAYDYMPDAFNKALVYNFIGLGYSKLGDSSKALFSYNKADSILSEKYDETFDLRMTLMELYAGELKKSGQTSEAVKIYKRLLDNVARVSGKKSQKYSRALYMYANSLRADGKNDNNAALYSESISILENILHNQLRYVQSSDRQFFINVFSERLWSMLSFALDYSDKDKSFVKRCYDVTIMLKSLLFESDRSMYNTLQLKGSDEDVADFIKMSSLRIKRKSLFRDYDEHKEEIDSIGLQIRAIDRKLTEKSKSYSEYTSFLDFKYEDVCKYLGDKDVLFDFFDYQEQDGRHMYVAYVVKKDLKYPLIVKMFEESQIDSLVNGQNLDVLYKEHMSDNVMQLFWNTLKPYVNKDGNVYYVPSGLLYQVSLESLPLQNGTLLGECYSFIRLSSARRIADIKKCLEGDKKAILYGGLKYDLSIVDMEQESMKFDRTRLYSMRSMAGGASKFSYLPETLRETEKISSILKKNGYDVVTYTEGEGTEESFLNMHNNSPQILHVATHGFYYTPEEAFSSSYLKGTTDAMFLSGLVLSGGNAAWLGKELPQGVLGGIISAGNISCLDLSNTNLVVLSACQSGQGKVTREGLFGLQRAFKKAGVQSMVMTLWNVSDVVTSEFMVEFYKNLFKEEHTDKKQAFMKAKNKIRKKYPEPLYWAGFVMVD